MPPDPETRAAIELEGVVKELGSERVLDGVELSVPTGATTVLLGPSGAGKTVTIKHILGLMRPQSGTVVVDGIDLATLNDDGLNELRRSLGVVLQGALPFSCGLFYSIDVFENVAFALRERTRLSPEQIEALTMESLALVGMRDHAGLMPSQLSAGMAKRTALARALALEARIVVIDDVDSGIDKVRLTLLCDLIAESQRETGATYLVTTHDMTVARRLADHIAVMHQGRIVASGEAEEIFASEEPLVRQLVTGGTSGPIRLASQ